MSEDYFAHFHLKNLLTSVVNKFFCVCAGHVINLTGESPVTGVTAKCSEPQVINGDINDEGSGVAKFLSLRTET